ncbi:HK97 gp10 family phage protein [Desmospora activa]|uniref:HK97 gp10 family phage protein n=1 Tax=Desmospora activa DSM 45169 TaxID=1121389 RepID=A0A2T4Z923_9BACL|nr:HK97 gp10 family phage protein [Desmospora activa]PTM58379.1 HK97 gp10 family phage protein [Desmospora activa DSM 45169]
MGYNSQIPRFNRELSRKERQTLEAWGVHITGNIKTRTPVDKGRLKGSIQHRVNEKNGSVIVGTNAEYAIPVEFGSGIHAENGRGKKTKWRGNIPGVGWRWIEGQKPQPYFRPGWEAARKDLPAIIRRIWSK